MVSRIPKALMPVLTQETSYTKFSVFVFPEKKMLRNEAHGNK